jgi:hypothetical protein
MATELITVQVTPHERERIAKLARDAGMSMDEFVRQAALEFRPDNEDPVLIGMINQMVKSTERASASIDDMLAFVEASNQRIAALEAQRAIAFVGALEKV